MTKFKTEVAVDFFNDYKILGLSSEKGSIESIYKIEIEWGVEMEYREWGVKGINVFVPDQEVVLSVDYHDYETDDTVIVEKKITLSNIKVVLGNIVNHGIVPETIEEYGREFKLIF